MRQLKCSKRTDVLDISKVLTKLQLPNLVKTLRFGEVLSILLPLCVTIFWSISLKSIDIRSMNDLGLVSVLPASTIIALVVLTLSFCLTLGHSQLRVLSLLLHLVLMIFMLYGITALVEEAPRFAVVYRHTGIVEYIMRTGSLAPTLDTYFNWPGFFILNAFLTWASGYHDTLSFAAWTAVFFNLIYLGPLYIIFNCALKDKRQVWLGLWFFILTNWIGQDYFQPQALGFFLYLVIIAILLKWFRVTPSTRSDIIGRLWQVVSRFMRFVPQLDKWLTTPDTETSPILLWQRTCLLVILVTVFATVVFSHLLTPFFILASVTVLVIFRRCTPFWLPILMIVMTVAWIYFMTQAFLAGHSYLVIGDFGHIGGAVSANVTSRVVGNPEHTFIVQIRIVMTFLVWLLACAGGVYRLFKGYRDITYVLLAIAPFPLFIAQTYGGEMLLRIYFFSLPMMVLFVTALFFRTSSSNSRNSAWRTATVIGMSIVLLGGFLFTRYGNERADYVTYDELNSVRYLYKVAAPNSLFIAGWGDGPFQFQDYEKHSYDSLDSLPLDAIADKNVNAVIQLIQNAKQVQAYLCFTRSQKASFDSSSRLPPGTLDQLENALLKSRKFKLIYSTHDGQILEYVH